MTGPSDASSITPRDAIVALRSFPRRFGEAMPPADDGSTEADALRRRVEDAAGQAAAAIEALARDLEAVLTQDDPVLGGQGSEPPRGGPLALDRLTAAATGLATLAERQDAEAWNRTGQRGGAGVSAADIMREAVQAAVSALRGATA